MTNPLSTNCQDLDLSKSESTQSILTLINLISDPAIIYHRTKDEILSANNAFYLLTNLGENDFLRQPIKTLLPNVTDTDPITGHDKPALLRHKKQHPISVLVRIYSLNNTKEQLLIVLQPEEIKPPNKQQEIKQAEILNQIHEIIQSEDTNDLRASLFITLEKTASLLNANLVSIYRSSSQQSGLRQYLSNDERAASDLPELITSEELVKIQQPRLWTPDTQALTKLEKKAANEGYQFLAMVPLGKSDEDLGLLVAGGKQKSQNPHNLMLSTLIADYITGFLGDQFRLQNVRNLANKIKQVVKIQNEIISNLDEGVVILSPDLTIAELNPTAETLLGYANVEALRQDIDSIIIGSESLRSAFLSAQQGIPTLTGGDLTLHHRTGKSFPAQVMITPVTSNGKLLSIVLLIRDLSQQEQALATRKQLEQRAILGEITAIFAHEVRNPINAIMLSLQVMEDNISETDENTKWVENIRDECNNLLSLMESVLSFAKPLEYKMTGVDLDQLLNRILERWYPRLARLNITSYFESEVNNPVVDGDLRALEQVFTNLISNAVNAMSDTGGSLSLKLTELKESDDQGIIQVTLTDSGHGIPEEIRANMFKPFITGSIHGTGLGLAITQRIINAHKGKIEVESFTGGTIFRVFLARKKGIQ